MCTILGLIGASEAREALVSFITATCMGAGLGATCLLVTLYVFEIFQWRRGLLMYLTVLAAYLAVGLPLIIYALTLILRWIR
jgi:hypothetical protein